MVNVSSYKSGIQLAKYFCLVNNENCKTNSVLFLLFLGKIPNYYINVIKIVYGYLI